MYAEHHDVAAPEMKMKNASSNSQRSVYLSTISSDESKQ